MVIAVLHDGEEQTGIPAGNFIKSAARMAARFGAERPSNLQR
jgi:hypothetical protein